MALDSIATLLRESILDHQNKGDLDGAWNDLVVMFRVAASGPAEYR